MRIVTQRFGYQKVECKVYSLDNNELLARGIGDTDIEAIQDAMENYIAYIPF